jgi:mono/diheme cytochrome c family protein
MARWKKMAAGVCTVAAVVALGAGIWAWRTFDTSRSDAADRTVRLADLHVTDAAAIKRGEYVMRLGDCAACHTRGQGDFAGGYEIETPFGTLVSSNITPDRETGIGNMTERDFFNALRQGVGQHGLLYPAMPYTAFSRFTDQDLHDLWAYMSGLPPVRNRIDENGGMRFPYNIRLAMAGWNMLFFDNKGFTPDPLQSEEWNRGRYIVEGGGHCGVCHTPRNVLGAERGGAALHGSELTGWYAPDITTNPHLGIGAASVANVIDYLKTGSDGVAVAAGPMAEVVEHSTQYFTDADLKAVAIYLKSMPPSPAEPRQPMPMQAARREDAALSYEVNCSACHGLQGEGIKGMVPAFAENHGLLADSATNLIHAMLMGARAPYTHDRQTAAGMPSFAWKFSDEQIAEVLNYVRNSWGNGALEVKAEDVARLRCELGAMPKLATSAQ